MLRPQGRKVLLVEPAYPSKYPPLGLMKIASYHKQREDWVTFVRGTDRSKLKTQWDRIYVSTLFTFHWRRTIETISFYLKAARRAEDVVVGGVMATLLGAEIERRYPVRVIRGLLDQPGVLDADDATIVDSLLPDYSILSETEHSYSLGDAYIAYASRGCTRRCDFCAVRRLEPVFEGYAGLRRQIRGQEAAYGPRCHLVLLDNNVLASPSFERIVNDLRDLGFGRGAVLGRRARRVDFNQGLDARLLTRERMALLATTAINPLRMALDHPATMGRYASRLALARDYGLLDAATYVLYNHRDTPVDFYGRLRLTCGLNEQLGTHAYSFPMRYVPLDALDRSYVGPNWSRRQLRGVQCILQATGGKVGTRLGFFEAAFGADAEEFERITMMPDDYIMFRAQHRGNGASSFQQDYSALSPGQRLEFKGMVATGRVTEESLKLTQSGRMRRLLGHYIESDRMQKARRAQPGRSPAGGG